jgi:hypothetical protein
MTKVIILQGDDLESFYQRTMDYLYGKYHPYVSMQVEPISPETENNHYEYYATSDGELPDDLDYDESVPPGKQVI